MGLTLHKGTSFLITDASGDIAETEHGYYFEDVRCLSAFRLRIDGQVTTPLRSHRTGENAGTCHCANPELDHVPENTLLIRRHITLGDGLREAVAITNYGDSVARFEVSLEFASDFADIFRVKRRAISKNEGGTSSPSIVIDREGNAVCLTLDQGGKRSSADLRFSGSLLLDPDRAIASVEIAPRRTWNVEVEVGPSVGFTEGRGTSIREIGRMRPADLRDQAAVLETDHELLAEAYQSAAHDLNALHLNVEEPNGNGVSVAAGIPWYLALFGRDSLIASYQSLLHDPSLMRNTLLALAHLQGERVDREAEEEPGKILHEYRRHMRASPARHIPRFPFFGSVDSTPLFLVSLVEYVRCTGDSALTDELWGNVERAVAWIEQYACLAGDELLRYSSRPGAFLKNKGWKDSGDSVRFRDGSLAEGPIALIEVQGYAVAAFEGVATLAARRGDSEFAEHLQGRAARLRELLVTRFWLDARGTFAEAIDGAQRQVDSLTSNPAQLLWTRSIPEEHAKRVAESILTDDMLSGFGVRTMGDQEGGYNPISYHNGSVWPHDNSLILLGLSRYRLDDATRTVASNLLAALRDCPGYRFPELFSGIGRRESPVPVAYPNSNCPQAWASAAIPLLVRSLAGLEVDAFARRLTVRPIAIPGLTYLNWKQLPIAGARADLHIEFRGAVTEVSIKGLPPGWHAEVPDTDPATLIIPISGSEAHPLDA